MDIMSLSFEEPLILTVDGEMVKLIPFKTLEHGNIKFGIQAPTSINIHREEIYRAVQLKQQTDIG